MQTSIEPGLTLTLEKIVLKEDTAARYGSGLIEVFATPAMVAFMEQTSLGVVQPGLPEGYNTVGIEISVKHIKASPVGMKVSCTALLERVEGKKLFFTLEAWDEEGKIGMGTHTRYIINTEEFMKSLTRK